MINLIVKKFRKEYRTLNRLEIIKKCKIHPKWIHIAASGGLINPYMGQEVVVYSDKTADSNSVQNAAKICQTIPYDILIGLAASTKRILI